MTIKYLDVVVGAQFGSEGKGHITAQLVQRAVEKGHTVVNVRVAGPNAGHTVIDQNGIAFPLRSVPVGAAISPKVHLYIAPGSEIELPVLLDEIKLLKDHGHKLTHFYVSGEATLLEEKHKQTEADNQLVDKIGSTGKGIGAARADRLLRGARRVLDAPEVIQTLQEHGVKIAEPNWMYQGDRHVIIEGTQGYGLGLHAGHYPQCTSSDTRAIDFLAMAGISPWHIRPENFGIWVVARVYPIRVAGNSGALAGETTWEDLGLPEEKTTVTKKTRRVGNWDPGLLNQAVRANGDAPTVRIAITMADQLFPDIYGTDNITINEVDVHERWKLDQFIQSVQIDGGAPVHAITTSPNHIIWRD
jgi:adenylosuccinate synthase